MDNLSVLLSNGFPYSKIWLKKFDFSPIDTPANIAQKLPSQRCFKPLFIAFFNFSHKRPTFAFVCKSEYTLGFPRKITHKGLHGGTCVSLLSCILNRSRLAGRLLFARTPDKAYSLVPDAQFLRSGVKI